MQVHFTGGEPLARKELEIIVQTARSLELTNLVTSGVPLTKERLSRSAVDHVQVSIPADEIAGYAAHSRKLEVMRW